MTRSIRPLAIARKLSTLLCALVCLAIADEAGAAPTVVTACGRDDAAGGVNLVQALAAGGEIVIRCAPGQGIRITATRLIEAGTSIDGEGKAVLTGTLKGPLFTLGIGSVTLRNLRVAASRDASTIAFANAGTIIEARNGAIRLENVHSEDARNAYSAISVTARGSKFINMGDAAPDSPPRITIDAERIELANVEFNGGIDHPVGGGSVPLPGRKPFARSLTITDSFFANVRNPLLITDSRVRIRNTRFLANGALAEAGSDYWGCCGGALTLIHSSVDIQGGSFESNRSSGFGGAIVALGSGLRLNDVTFRDNQARAGGAILSWGRRPLLHSWGALASSVPGLSLTRTRFIANSASLLGGAILFAGQVDGHAVLLARNRAPQGGAIAGWRAFGLAPPHDQVLGGLEAATDQAPDILSLARPIFVDNQAGNGAAVLGGSADVRLGNALLVRNGMEDGSASGAILIGDRISLANSTLVQNWNPALALQPAATVRLANSILSNNRGGNCMLSGAPVLVGANLQYPGQSCGTAVTSNDPGLGADYVPGPLSPARGSGDIGTCAADPVVRGVDLYGEARLKGGRCDLGAIERDLLSTLAAGLPGDDDLRAKRHCLILILLIVFVLVLLLVLLLLIRRRRRRDGKRRTLRL